MAFRRLQRAEEREENAIRARRAFRSRGRVRRRSRQRAYIMKGMPKVNFPVTTKKPKCQAFNQGIGQLHGFGTWRPSVPSVRPPLSIRLRHGLLGNGPRQYGQREAGQGLHRGGGQAQGRRRPGRSSTREVRHVNTPKEKKPSGLKPTPRPWKRFSTSFRTIRDPGPACSAVLGQLPQRCEDSKP